MKDNKDKELEAAVAVKATPEPESAPAPGAQPELEGMPAEEQAESPAEEGQEQEIQAEKAETPAKAKAGGLRERLRKHYPDVNLDDEETYNKTLEDHINGLEDYKAKNEGVINSMLEAFNTHPELAGMMRDIIKGASVPEAIARNIDMEGITPQEGDPDYESWSKALSERKKKAEEIKNRQKAIDDNVQVSAKVIRDFKDKNKIPDDKMNDFLNELDEFVGNAINAKITEPMLTRLYRAANADEEVQAAAKAAEIKAKNGKVEVAKKEMKKRKGDGLPHLGGTGSNKEEKQPVYADNWNKSIAATLGRKVL